MMAREIKLIVTKVRASNSTKDLCLGDILGLQMSLVTKKSIHKKCA
jgi:hypothetical protein